jgi:hypothetical protein
VLCEDRGNPGHRRKKSTWWMPRRHWPMKDVPTRRNALGRRWEPVSQRSPNGATPLGNQGPTVFGPRREPGELKHLTYPEEQRGFP